VKFASQISKETREQYAEEMKAYAGKDVNDLAVEHFKLAKTVRERGIIIPTKDSSEEEIQAFHDRMGLPRKPEGYELKADEKVLPKEAVEAARAFVAANGYTQKQAQAYVSSLESIARNAQEISGRRRAEGEKNVLVNLAREIGGDEVAAKETYNLAVKHLSSNYSSTVRQKLIDTGVLYDAAFLKEAAAAQSKIEPHGLVTGDAGKGETEKPKPQGKQGNYSPEWIALHGKKGA
jgi:predicted DsbA family dithiol-disulfide isomerase